MPGEGRLAKCGRCGMQVNSSLPGHRATKYCELMWQVSKLRRTVVAAAKALNVKFHIRGVQLENIAVFKYLGHFLALDDVDTQVASGDLKKARRV